MNAIRILDAGKIVSRRPVSGRVLNDLFDTECWEDGRTYELRTMGDGSIQASLPPEASDSVKPTDEFKAKLDSRSRDGGTATT